MSILGGEAIPTAAGLERVLSAKVDDLDILESASYHRGNSRLARRAPSTPEEGRVITNVRGLVVLASMQVEDAAVLRGDAAVARRAEHVSSCDYYVDDDGDRRRRHRPPQYQRRAEREPLWTCFFA